MNRILTFIEHLKCPVTGVNIQCLIQSSQQSQVISPIIIYPLTSGLVHHKRVNQDSSPGLSKSFSLYCLCQLTYSVCVHTRAYTCIYVIYTCIRMCTYIHSHTCTHIYTLIIFIYIYIYSIQFLLKLNDQLGMLVYVSNPSYFRGQRGGGIKRIMRSRPAQAKLARFYLKKKKKGLGV